MKRNLIFSTGRCAKALSPSKQRAFKKIIRRAIENINPSANGNIAITFATKNEIKKIKKQFCGINQETDVLAFDYGKNSCAPTAEIIICPQIAKESAPEFGQDYFCELLLYAVHGILHLAGYNDTTSTGAKIMRKMECHVMDCLDKEFDFMLSDGEFAKTKKAEK